MARILWLNWSGGGNLPPSLGIARVLTERGHAVAFAGRPEMVPRVKTAGLPGHRDHAGLRAGRSLSAGQFPDPRLPAISPRPRSRREVRAIVAAEAPDIVAHRRDVSRRAGASARASDARRRCSSTPSCFASSTCGAG